MEIKETMAYATPPCPAGRIGGPARLAAIEARLGRAALLNREALLMGAEALNLIIDTRGGLAQGLTGQRRKAVSGRSPISTLTV